MTSSEFATYYGQSGFADSTIVPTVWLTSEHLARHEPSDAVQWEPALRPQDRPTDWAFVSVVLLTNAVIASAAVLALYS